MSKLVTAWAKPNSAYPAGDVAHITPKLISAPKAAREKWATLDAELDAREKLVKSDWNNRAGIPPAVRAQAIESEIKQLRADFKAKKIAVIDEANDAMSGNLVGLEHAQRRFGHKARWMLDVIHGSKLAGDAAAWSTLIAAMGPTERAQFAQSLVAESGQEALTGPLIAAAYTLQAAERAKAPKDRAFALDGDEGFLTALSIPSYDRIKAGIDEAARELAAFERESNDIRLTGQVSTRTKMANALAAGALEPVEGEFEETQLPDGPTAKIARGLAQRQTERA